MSTLISGLTHVSNCLVIENPVPPANSLFVLKVFVNAGYRLIYKPNDNFMLGILDNFDFVTKEDTSITASYNAYIVLGESAALTPVDVKNLNINFCELLNSDLETAMMTSGNYGQDNSPQMAQRRKPKTLSYSKTATTTKTMRDRIIDFLISLFYKLRRFIEKILLSLYRTRFMKGTK